MALPSAESQEIGRKQHKLKLQTNVGWEVPKKIVRANEALLKSFSRRGVYLNYLKVEGDWIFATVMRGGLHHPKGTFRNGAKLGQKLARLFAAGSNMEREQHDRNFEEDAASDDGDGSDGDALQTLEFDRGRFCEKPGRPPLPEHSYMPWSILLVGEQLERLVGQLTFDLMHEKKFAKRRLREIGTPTQNGEEYSSLNRLTNSRPIS